MHYVYSLSDPRDGRVRYIGRSRWPDFRLNQHLSAASKGNKTRVYDWMRELLKAGAAPRLSILFKADALPIVLEIERQQIRAHRSSALNLYGHGRTPKPGEKPAQKIQPKKGLKLNWLHNPSIRRNMLFVRRSPMKIHC